MHLEQTDVIVVGGGLAGVATAFALRERGFDVVLLEQRFLAFGASGRSLGAVWSQDATSPEQVADLRATHELYARLEHDLGIDAEFSKVGGYAYAETDEELAALETRVAEHRLLGVPAELIDPSDARASSSFVPETAIGAAFYPDDARVNAAELVRALGETGRKLGVRIYEHTPVIRVTRHGDTVTGVLTTRGEIRASAVVWAAGPWVQQLEPDGVAIPLEVVRVGMLQTQPTGPISSSIARSASTLLPRGDARLRFEETYVQTADGRIVVGSTFDEAGSLNPHLTADAATLLIGSFSRRLPELGSLGVTGLWAGLVGLTRDGLPIIDRVGGLFVNTGHAHGALTALISGEQVAKLIAGEATSHELAHFSIDRASLGEPSKVEQ